MKKMKQYRNDEAVSPVIGVILMVAITVILAAVIAAFVFGMAGNVSKTKNVAFTASKGTSNTITVTNNGGQDVTSLNNPVSINLNGAVPTLIGSSTFSINGTGNTTQFTGTASKDHVIVTGYFNDGSQAVLLDTYV